MPPQSAAIVPNKCAQARIGSSSAKCLCLSLTCFLSLQVMIEELPDKMLLGIFRYYLNASPRFWPTLVHICHRWRSIVLASQQALQLRLFCTDGTPVRKALDCWPALPVVVQYGGSLALDPPSPEDEGNIIAALKQSDRVSSISLAVTSSLLDILSGSFTGLEVLVLLPRSSICQSLTLPSAFRYGPCLRYLGIST